MPIRHDLTTYLSLAGLALLCGFFAYAIGRYGVMFYREARGTRRLSTLAGAAAVIAIIVSIVVGTLIQPLATLTPPPVKTKAGPADSAPLEAPQRRVLSGGRWRL